MSTINHAATALLIKKKAPTLSMLALLVSVQLVEILWVLFNYIGDTGIMQCNKEFR